MPLILSDPTRANGGGLVELMDDTLKTSSTSYPLAEKVRDLNLAQARAKLLISQASGKWQGDDPNHTKLSTVLFDLVAGQRDYSFRYDEQGNEILDLFKVLVADQNFVFHELEDRDQQGESEEYHSDISSFTDGLDVQGTPQRMDLTGNSIILDPIPSYSWRLAQEGKQGIKALINREDTHFTTTDLTRVPGIIGNFHEYLALRASYKKAQRDSMAIAGGKLKNGARTGLLGDVYDMEQDILTYYGSRERAGKNRMTAAPIIFR